MKKIQGNRAFDIFNCIFLALLSFVFLFPFWKVLMMSLNDATDLARGGINFWPRQFTLENYRAVFRNPTVLPAYQITLARTLLGTVTHVVCSSMMAYALSRDYFKPRKLINLMIIVTMFFNGGLIPTFLVYRQLKLLNTFWVYIIPALYGTSSIFIFRAGFRSLPKELIDECAKLDGASDLVVFFRIVIPLSLPIYATLTLFTAVGHWNDYMTAILYVSSSKLVPIQTLLYRMLTSMEAFKSMGLSGATNVALRSTATQTAESVKMTTIIITAAPIICLYPFLQRYFVKGIFVGSLKG